jgi:ubiquinone/menaquinone biosynthesis C-methylase UbiE
MLVQIFSQTDAAFTEQQVKINQKYDGRAAEYREGSNKVQWIGPQKLVEKLSLYLPNFAHLDEINHLDLGCGTGEVREELNKQTDKRIITTGVDPSYGMLEEAANRKLLNVGHQRLATDLDFVPDQSQQIVTGSGVFDYFNDEDPVVLAQQLKRVITPGGTFAFTFEAEGTQYPGPKNNKRFDANKLVKLFTETVRSHVEASALNPAWLRGDSQKPVENIIIVGHVPYLN